MGDHTTPKITQRHPSLNSSDLNQKDELECVTEHEGATVYDRYKNGILSNVMETDGKLVTEKAVPSDSHCVVTSRNGGKTTSKKAKVTVGRFKKLCLPNIIFREYYHSCWCHHQTA